MKGTEEIGSYAALQPKVYKPRSDETRQMREMLRFASQVSFLQWSNPSIFIDPSILMGDGYEALLTLASPDVLEAKEDKADQILSLGSRSATVKINLKLMELIIPDPDVSFSEGKARRTTHLRYERSSKLREIFFEHSPAPYCCDMCGLNVSCTYSWVPNLLELHHLLPLASPIRVESTRTSLSDLVAICPSCHRAVHTYYRQWLKKYTLEDFRSKDEALTCYDESKAALN